MRNLFHSGLVALFAVFIVIGVNGCISLRPTPTPQAATFYTFSATKDFVDAAEKTYGNLYALGYVSKANEAKIDAKIIEFHRAFLAAVRVARGSYSSVTPGDVQKLADSLVIAINQLKK